MYYWPVMRDMFGTLPPAERDELISLLILGPEYTPEPDPPGGTP